MTIAPRIGQIKEITSLSNPILKELRSLSMKKVRDREKIFLVEGLEIVIDALELGWTIKTLVFSKEELPNAFVEQTLMRVISIGGLVIKTTDAAMKAITRRDNPQKIIGVFKQKTSSFSALKQMDDRKKGQVYLGLDRIRDPGNLGTIIRTADAVGVSGIFLIGDVVDPFSTETVRATMGSIFSVPLYCGDEVDFLKWRKEFSGLLVGTHLKGAVDYRTIDYMQKGTSLLLMGNEKQGLSDKLSGCCDYLACIPQVGRAESLNIAIATAVMLYEIRREALVINEGKSL